MDTGLLVAVVGAMGSGKTEKLIEVKKELESQGASVGVFKPLVDLRSPAYEVRSRNGEYANCVPVTSISEIYEHGGDLYDNILIDEVQFFNEPDLANSLITFTLLGINVFVFGLDLTSDGKPFGYIGDVLANADEVIKLHNTCNRCGDPARVTHYNGKDKEGDVKIGDLDLYEPLCRDCFYMDAKGIGNALEFLEDSDEELLSFSFGNEEIGFNMDLVLTAKDLENAGYSYDDIMDISTIEGVNNLLIDLGLDPLHEDGDIDE